MAVAVVVFLVVTLGYALRPEEPSRRRLLAEVVALKLSAGMDGLPVSSSISAEEDRSRAAPGRPGGYRRAVMLRDPLLPCPEGARPVTCGAKLEIFRRRSTAVDRADSLAAATGEAVVRRGALVLRLSTELPASRQLMYRQEFLAVVDDLVAFRELARVQS